MFHCIGFKIKAVEVEVEVELFCVYRFAFRVQSSGFKVESPPKSRSDRFS